VSIYYCYTLASVQAQRVQQMNVLQAQTGGAYQLATAHAMANSSSSNSSAHTGSFGAPRSINAINTAGGNSAMLAAAAAAAAAPTFNIVNNNQTAAERALAKEAMIAQKKEAALAIKEAKKERKKLMQRYPIADEQYWAEQQVTHTI
jgi:hypothetical protein